MSKKSLFLCFSIFWCFATTHAQAQEVKGRRSGVIDRPDSISVSDEACSEENSPCDWLEFPAHKLLNLEYMPTPPNIQRFMKTTEGLLQTATINNNLAVAKKIINCQVYCLIDIGRFTEGYNYAVKKGFDGPIKVIKELETLEKQLHATLTQLQIAEKNHDTEMFIALDKKLGSTRESINTLVNKLPSIGSCHAQKNPMECFTKRVDWQGAFRWAKQGSTEKEKAAKNLCWEFFSLHKCTKTISEQELEFRCYTNLPRDETISVFTKKLELFEPQLTKAIKLRVLGSADYDNPYIFRCEVVK